MNRCLTWSRCISTDDIPVAEHAIEGQVLEPGKRECEDVSEG